MDKIDQLEKELMLPRNGFNLKPKLPFPPKHDFEVDERENTKALGNRSNVGIANKPKTIQVLAKPNTSLKPQTSPPRPQPQLSSQKRANEIKNVINAVSSANNAISANISNLGYNNIGYNSNPKTNINNFVGRHPQEEIDLLSEKHDEYIELILE